jgi:hypothetical protein
LCPEPSNLGGVDLDLWPTKGLAFPACAFKASPCALGNPNPLLLGERRHNRNHCIPENAAGVEPLLRETPVANSIAGEPVHVGEGLKHSLAGKSVERPEKRDIELPPAGGLNHCLELFAVIG